MLTMTKNVYAFSQARSGTARRTPRGLTETLALWSARHQERRALADMPDHLLADMGIDRAEARKEARKPFWRG